MVQLFNTDNSSALWKPAAAHKGTFFALSDYQLTFLALIALYAGGLGGRFRRQDVALLVQLKSCFAVRIFTASQERAESTVFMQHRLAALGAFMFAYLIFEHLAFFVAGTGKRALGIC